MTRRKLLKKICTLISVFWIAVVSIPFVRYVLSPLKKKSVGPKKYKLTRLDQLKTNTPQMFNIVSDHRDAWMVYHNETVGRVWINRTSDVGKNPADTPVQVFSAICPHLGCTIQMKSDNKTMVCPCHKGIFHLNGDLVSSKELGHNNPVPRNMDSLNYEIIKDESSGEWWIEVEFQKFKLGPTKKIPL